MKKENTYIIEKWAPEGKTLSRKEGKIVFIPYAIPGEKVNAIIHKNKKNYAEAYLTHIIEASPLRKQPDCEYFGECGGCRWQHISYEQQLQVKHQLIAENFDKIGNFVYPPIPMPLAAPQPLRYRNKVDFSFSTHRWLTKKETQDKNRYDKNFALGFHRPENFSSVIDINDCLLCSIKMNEVKNYVRQAVLKKGIPAYNHKTHEGILRGLILRENQQGSIMLALSATMLTPDIEKILYDTFQHFSFLRSVYVFINTKKNESLYDVPAQHLYGDLFLTEQLNDIIFRIHPLSFFQTNTQQALRLYNEIKNMASLFGNEIIYDLYCGVGSIGLFLAAQCQKVIGIESVTQAVDDAKENALINHISHAIFLAGDIRKLLSKEFFDQQGHPDIIIADPPRNGMDADVCRTLNESGCPRIIYVSCNPATQARDLNILTEKYTITAIQPVDMFPQTHHIENIVLLTKK